MIRLRDETRLLLYLYIAFISNFVGGTFTSLRGGCSALPCRNGGRCVQLTNDVFKCICARGFSGEHCERRCDCLNGGECFDRASFPICICPVGFNGSRCEFRQPSVCDSEPCGTNGKCHLTKSTDEFRCECIPGFMGEKCDQVDHCADEPCADGVCISLASGFKCTCPIGLRGSRCEIDVNECLSSPCIRGRCINEVGRYRCECPFGYAGHQCEKRVDPCDPSPCKNDAQCFSYRDRHFTCECRAGFTGRRCEVNIDDCTENACLNGGTCVDGEQGYTCNCPPGFTGKLCERDVDECESGEQLCLNGGTCVNRKGGYHCICVNGWEGENCAINKDDCVDALCEAGSTCVDHVAKYTCECPPGRIGLLCHMEDPCLSNPCKAGSQCEADTSSGKYTCSCPKGFTGEDCSEDINECEQGTNVCWNGGTCVNTPGSWHCECPPGFTDSWCMSHVNQCLPSPCLNQGTCLDFGTGFKCVCMSGFHGKFCEQKCPPGFEGDNCERRQHVECNSTDCLNGGVCSKGACRCPLGFTGDRCERRSDPCKYHSCAPNAVCVPSANGIDYRCECKFGFYGHDCRQELNECASNPCQHGGICADHAGGFTCLCAAGYTGDRCQRNVDDCASSPCLNGGICIDGVNTFSCHCALPYDGDRCQYKLDPCRGHRCENGGLCRPTSNYKNYTCECASGYEGPLCRTDVDECFLYSPCKNGGQCVNVEGSYRCRCRDGFAGHNCENDVDDCMPNPCKNGARCVDEVNGYHCECLAGFTGAQCATNIDDCASSPCENGATCLDRINGFECVCRPGFSGVRCHSNDDDCQPGICLNGGTCLDGVNDYQCRCERGYTGRNCERFVDLEQFNKTDVLEQELCRRHECAHKASNGICDAACNYYACGYDGGDCSAGIKPFDKCSSPSYCAHVFRDRKCDAVCNNEDCLFDGFDCDNVHDRCAQKQFCASRYADGNCDSVCNSVGCGWDGGDCDQWAENGALLAGDVMMVLLVRPEDFLKNVQTFLLTLSQKLRASVSIRFVDGKPMIYSWNSETGVGPLVEVPSEKLPYLSSTYRRDKRHAHHPLSGTMVMLALNVARCREEDRGDCFSDLMSVVSFLGAANAKQELQELGMPMYSARAEISPVSEERSSPLKAILISCVVVVVIVVVAFLMVQQGRKRKTIHAHIWHPPPTDSCKSSTANLDTYSVHSGFLFNGCGSSTKRTRSDVPVGIAHPNLYVGDDTQLFLKPKSEPVNGDERSWTLLHEEADSKQPITTPVDPSLVNVRGKGGRTALMQTASNQAKSESSSVDDIRNLLKAGAHIDAQDDCEDTALMLAVKSGRRAVVEFLLDSGADPTIVDERDRTPLHHAVAVQSIEIVQLLLDTGRINVDALDVDNRTALIVCAKYDMMGPEIAELLLKAKADVACTGDKSATNYDGKTALHFAAQHSNLEIIKVLIQHGANKDAQDQLDQTPLFLAASEGHAEAVELLLSVGASKEITDQKERSPRDVAAEKLFLEVVNLLDSMPAQRIIPLNINNRAPTLNGSQQRTKKNSKKPNQRGSTKKAVCVAAYGAGVSQSSANPLTPPLSDGSNYSTTPSPSNVHPSMRTTVHSAHPEGTLQASSVMLSPYSDHQNGSGCSPPQIMVPQRGWPRSDLASLHYDDGQCYGANTVVDPYSQGQLQEIYSQQYAAQMQQPNPYYNI